MACSFCSVSQCLGAVQMFYKCQLQAARRQPAERLQIRQRQSSIQMCACSRTEAPGALHWAWSAGGQQKGHAAKAGATLNANRSTNLPASTVVSFVFNSLHFRNNNPDM